MVRLYFERFYVDHLSYENRIGAPESSADGSTIFSALTSLNGFGESRNAKQGHNDEEQTIHAGQIIVNLDQGSTLEKKGELRKVTILAPSLLSGLRSFGAKFDGNR
jgi:hypothetical protein